MVKNWKGASKYIGELVSTLAKGISTEHSYRPALKNLMESVASGVEALNEPKRVACGAPDFIVFRDTVPIGHIEAKDIGISLNDIEQTEQLQRYLVGLPNIIVTNHTDFRLYQEGSLVASAKIARISKGKVEGAGTSQADLEHLLDAFFSARFPVVTNAKELADRMAGIAKLISDSLTSAFQIETASGHLHHQLQAFRQVLLHDLSWQAFVDMYTQTICYGLFAARCNHDSKKAAFTRQQAAFELPETNPFLRQMFSHIAGPSLDSSIAWAVDHLATLLDRADFQQILSTFGKKTRQEDPVVHFYETFLSAYNPQLREKRGVYYTPEPVVSFIVRSIDSLLKRQFSITDGLCSTEMVPVFKDIHSKSKTARTKTGDLHKVIILDPAAGTGTFLHSVVAHIHAQMKRSKQLGAWDSYVSRHLLPRLFGFELLMAPYSICHMKLGLQLGGTGYKFSSGERLRVYMTNSLEEAFELGGLPLFASLIAQEAAEAGNVKNENPVMVILGNPPYQGNSINESPYIHDLMRGHDRSTGESCANYFEAEGKSLGERNPKWLNDDYVKFIRFAQKRIEQTGYGILAFITNHAYLDNPTFRGMRESLIEAFDQVYVLDLHGNAKRKEVCPDGSRDENVFDIQQGTAISIFVKKASSKGKQGSKCLVMHADLWGLRETSSKGRGKYDYLDNENVESVAWTRIKPEAPYFLFIPQDKRLWKEYEGFVPLNTLFRKSVLGFQTHRDHFAIGHDEPTVASRINDLRVSKLSEPELAAKYDLKNNRDWHLADARASLRKNAHWRSSIRRCLYRPFDERYCYFGTEAMDYPRRLLIDHVADGGNLCLLAPRQISVLGFRHVFATELVAESCVVSTKTKEQNYVFPLYIFDSRTQGNDPQGDLLTGQRNGTPNVDTMACEGLSAGIGMQYDPMWKGRLQRKVGAEHIFHYVYAILHSNVYRSRYQDFLKMDFARIPMSPGKDLFLKLVEYGRGLVSLHTLKERPTSQVSFPVKGTNQVKKVAYNNTAQRLYINADQYFGNVEEVVWHYYVGSYRVVEKWLQERKGMVLSYDDIIHMQTVVQIVLSIVGIVEQIDEAITDAGGFLGAFE